MEEKDTGGEYLVDLVQEVLTSKEFLLKTGKNVNLCPQDWVTEDGLAKKPSIVKALALSV